MVGVVIAINYNVGMGGIELGAVHHGGGLMAMGVGSYGHDLYLNHSLLWHCFFPTLSTHLCECQSSLVWFYF